MPRRFKSPRVEGPPRRFKPLRGERVSLHAHSSPLKLRAHDLIGAPSGNSDRVEIFSERHVPFCGSLLRTLTKKFRHLHRWRFGLLTMDVPAAISSTAPP